eukprot:535269_1
MSLKHNQGERNQEKASHEKASHARETRKMRHEKTETKQRLHEKIDEIREILQYKAEMQRKEEKQDGIKSLTEQVRAKESECAALHQENESIKKGKEEAISIAKIQKEKQEEVALICVQKDNEKTHESSRIALQKEYDEMTTQKEQYISSLIEQNNESVKALQHELMDERTARNELQQENESMHKRQIERMQKDHDEKFVTTCSSKG